MALVLSSSVQGPLPEMAVSNGLRPGLAMIAKQLADELGPRGIRVNGLLPGRVGTERVAELDALADDPAAAKARAAERSRCDATASRQSSAVPRRSCSAPPRRSSPAPCSPSTAASLARPVTPRARRSRFFAGCWARRRSARPVASSQAR